MKTAQQEAKEQSGGDAVQDTRDEFAGFGVDLTELSDVLFRDVGGRIASDGRWPLIIDASKRSSVFLRYQARHT